MTNITTDQTESDALHELLERFQIPRWATVHLTHDSEQIGDLANVMAQEFSKPGIGDQIRPGLRVALTGGSRGIDRIADILAAAAHEIKQRGGEPFIVPAMGSHGGAVAEGQIEILEHYGITAASMGCPIRASMEVVEIGQLPSGERLYTDKIAYSEADLIVPVNRVKPHTDFHGPLESGLFKMLAIGLGKQRGADSLHASGFENFSELIPRAGQYILDHLPVPFGIASVDNGYGQCARVEAVPAANMAAREAELLEEARQRLARLPVKEIDVLVIEQIGKEISGSGMDPNVLGRYFDQKLPGGPETQRIVVLDVTAATEGNAAGIGMAHICTERAAAKVDRAKTYINQLTSKTPEGGRLPMVAPNDRAAIQMALASLRRADYNAIRMIRIKNTKDLTHIWASEALLEELVASGRAEVLDEATAPAFNSAGNLW